MEMDSKSPLKCIYCDKIYKERKRLTEHIKRSHKRNLAGENILTSTFTCDTCGKVFGRKDHLNDHIKNLHNSSEEFKCNYCTYKSKCSYNLKKHILKCDVNNKNVTPKNFVCSYCKTGYKYKRSLKRHEKKVHGIQRRLRKQKNRKCPLCSFTSGSNNQNEINTHFSKVHDLALKPEVHRFDNMDDFYKWKDDLEKRTYTFYAKCIQNANGGYYKCHRRGPFKRTGTKRHLKLDGSCKINGHCPSEIKVKISKSGTVSVFYVPTHVGHTNKLKFSKLSKNEKQIIACQLLQKTPHEEILKKIRNSVDCRPALHRIHLTHKKDIVNIERQLDNSEAERHRFDPISVGAWVEELRASDDTALLLYKPQGQIDEKLPEISEDDFLLVFMSKAQKAFLSHFGQETVCIDGTHGVNNYNFQLYTIHTIDECREGFPCAFMFTNKGDESTMSLFFRAIKEVTGTIQTKVFMSDMEETFYSAWIQIMGPSNMRLFCTWHVLKAWRSNLNKIKIKEKREDVYLIMKTLLYELDVDTFHKILDSAIEKLNGDPDTKAYSDYFKGQYVNNDKYRHWAYCYRTHAGINTNMSLENFNKILKYCYLKGKKVQRLDKTVCAILDLLKDKLFDYLIKTERGKLVRKVQELRKRHKKSLIIPSENVVQDNEKWTVLSSDKTEMYSVKKVEQCKKCRLQCLHCNSCFHEFICTCMDNSIKSNMCKHIHAVARTIPEQVTTQPDEETPLIIEEQQQQPIPAEVIVSEINNDNNINVKRKFEECWNLIPMKANTELKQKFATKKINSLLAALDAMDATEDLSAKKSISRVNLQGNIPHQRRFISTKKKTHQKKKSLTTQERNKIALRLIGGYTD